MNDKIICFLEELRENNNRIWFGENKERYDQLRNSFLEEVQLLISRIVSFDKEIVGLDAKDCIFRIYRDIRFSPNKQPYKNHFAAYLALGGKNSERAGYYLHLEPGNCMLSGGIWCPSPPILKKLRRDIYNNMDEFINIIEDPSFKAIYPKLEGEQLRRMPAGFPVDYPYDYILKHKDFCVYNSKPDQFFSRSEWVEEAAADFKKLFPFNRFLNYSVDELSGRV